MERLLLSYRCLEKELFILNFYGGDNMCQEDRMYVLNNEKVVLERDIKGNRVLDIGGGGEGIIGLSYGSKVVAIDQRKEELEEAPEGPLKLVMDARELTFLDNSFDTVTSFFTLMYVKKEEHEKVLSEIYRVLKNHGAFILWDVTIPKYDNSIKDIFVIQLEIDTPAKLIKTGYGVLRKDKEQNIEHFINIGKKVGFNIIKEEKGEHIFKIIFKK